MAVYEYKGLTPEGRDATGIIDADSPRSARMKLRQSGIYPTDVREGREEASRGLGPTASSAEVPGRAGSWLTRIQLGESVGGMEVALMTRHLATLTAAKLPLMEALTALTDQLDKGDLKRIVAGIRERVKEGSSLAVALGQYPSVFSEVYINMVKAGEASGTLDGMLLRLADYLENQVKLRNQLITALTYPIFMVVIGGAVLFFLVSYVVPKVTMMFEDMNQVLPWPTVVLNAVSHFLNQYWWAIFLIGVIGWIGLQQYIKTPAGRNQFDQVSLKLPILGRLTLLVAISRFARTLSTLLTSGVPLLQALDVVKNVVQNTVLAAAIDQARKNIGEGDSLAAPLEKSGMFPPLVTHMIAMGEKSGELEPMLVKVSEAYDNEVEAKIGALTAILSPVLILFMGGIVLFIVLAILLPIFELSQIVG